MSVTLSTSVSVMASPSAPGEVSGEGSASVDAKAELSALLDQWEKAQQGTTDELVIILTKSVLVP